MKQCVLSSEVLMAVEANCFTGPMQRILFQNPQTGGELPQSLTSILTEQDNTINNVHTGEPLNH